MREPDNRLVHGDGCQLLLNPVNVSRRDRILFIPGLVDAHEKDTIMLKRKVELLDPKGTFEQVFFLLVLNGVMVPSHNVVREL